MGDLCVHLLKRHRTDQYLGGNGLPYTCRLCVLLFITQTWQRQTHHEHRPKSTLVHQLSVSLGALEHATQGSMCGQTPAA